VEGENRPRSFAGRRALKSVPAERIVLAPDAAMKYCPGRGSVGQVVSLRMAAYLEPCPRRRKRLHCYPEPPPLTRWARSYDRQP